MTSSEHCPAPPAVAFASLLLALAGCGSDGPTAPRASVPVRLCTTADWFAYRNEGGQWTRLVPRDGELTFDGTERLAFALANAGAAPQVHVSYVTASQLMAVYGCDRGVPSTPPEQIGGVVRGLAVGASAQVAYGRFGRFVHWSDTVYTLPVESGSSDFLAAHVPSGAWIADRLVLRRAQAYPAGTSLPIDFAAAEAFAPVEHALRVDAAFALVEVWFWTATTRPVFGGVQLAGATVGEAGGAGTPRSVPLVGIPASRLVAGDLHRVMLDDMAGRTVESYFHAPRDLSPSFGPPAALPSVVTETTTPYRRLRVEIPVQQEYATGARILIGPYAAAGGSVVLSATREHFGGALPATWSLVVPDFSGVEGFEARFGLPSSGQLRWSMSVTGRPGGAFAPLVPADGLTFRAATRDGILD